MGIGPELPPHLAAAIGPSAPAPPAPSADSDSDDDFAPSLPPDLIHSRTEKKVLGPQLPPEFASAAPAPLKRKRETPLSNAYSDASDDDYGPGPMPLPAGYDAGAENEGARLFREREEREKEKERKAKEGDGKMKREEWMLVPPKEMDLLSSMDTTKLKSRSFAQSSKPHSSSTKEGKSEVNLWTETPAERQQRMQDELMGKKRRVEVSNGGGGEEEMTDDERRRRVRDRQLKEEVERHNKATRSESLLATHSKSSKSKAKEKDDGPPGIWDRDRDMGVGGRLMDDSKRNDIVKNAKELGGRFGGGGYL